MQPIYVIEDEQDIRDLLHYALTSAGYRVEAFESGSTLWEALRNGNPPSLMLLDIMLPGDDGLAILQKMRAIDAYKHVPIILLTAKSGETDTVKGLNLGADDYVSKPFRIMELLSRIRALLRRSLPATQSSQRSVFKGIILDRERRTAAVNGELIELTYKEYELLDYLLINEGIALSRSRIMENVWGGEMENSSRTLDMHIRSLRKKLGDYGPFIQTVRNIGYKLGD